MCNARFIKPSYIRSLYSAVLKKCPRFGMYGFLAFSDYHYDTITLYLCSVVLHYVVLHNSALFKNLMWYLQLTNLHQRRRFFFLYNPFYGMWQQRNRYEIFHSVFFCFVQNHFIPSQLDWNKDSISALKYIH